jgi:hypothetical protein
VEHTIVHTQDTIEEISQHERGRYLGFKFASDYPTIILATTNKQQQVFEDAVRALRLGLMDLRFSRGRGREKEEGKKQGSWLVGENMGSGWIAMTSCCI